MSESDGLLRRLHEFVVFFLLFAFPLGGAFAFQKQKQVAEDQEDYFRLWLNEDVVYIISEEEKKVFQNLSTAEEKEQFIEQFWFRRDPDPRTAFNEFKEEHYRRIAYANEMYSSGIPGWLTDRGRVYIIHGPPAEIESHPSGGQYQRPFHEGGGSTSTFPFEVWRYRYIEGMGTDIVIEFVDPTLSGEYRLALAPEEKDALLFVPGAGLTMGEAMGLSTKADRPYFRPGSTQYNLYSMRAQDSSFARYERYTQIQRATPVKYTDLKSLVEVNVSYDDLPFVHRVDYFSLNDETVLIPISLEVRNSELTFKEDDGAMRAKVAVYGIVTSLSNRVIDEFETDLVAQSKAQVLSSAYQRIVVVPRKGRYKLDLVLKDLNSGRVGVRRMALIPPRKDEEKLTASSLLLAKQVSELSSAAEQDDMFVLGDLHIRPSLDKTFGSAEPFNVYLQVYNAAMDQATMQPSLKVQYEVRRDDDTIIQVTDEEGSSIQYLSDQRIVLLQPLSLRQLQPGPYRLVLKVTDLVKDQHLEVTDSFKVAEPAAN